MENMDFFGLFDFQEGDDDTYEYTATEFSKLYASMITDGVVNSIGGALAVSANGLAITVATGACFIGGRYGENSQPKYFTATSGSHSDILVVRSDIAGRKIGIELKPNTTEITNTTFIKEIPLAIVKVDGNETTIEDKRHLTYTNSELHDKLNAVLTGTDFVYARYM